MSASLTDLQKKQIEQAEELLFDGPAKEGFAKDLYFGRFRTDSIMPYPEPGEGAKSSGDSMVEKTKKFCREFIDPDQIDRQATIPDSVIKGLANIGVLGMTIGKDHGGAGMTQYNYCRVMEIIGVHR